MPDLGTKHECTSCSTKFYDLGKPEPICPKCGLNQLAEDEPEPEPEAEEAAAEEAEEPPAEQAEAGKADAAAAGDKGDDKQSEASAG